MAVGAESMACAQLWDPGVTKELNGVPTQQADGSWLLSYTMSVTNPSAVQLSYGLVDQLEFPAGTEVTVVSAASRAGGPTVESDWNGQSQPVLVADGAALPANAIHIFDVTLRALLPEDQESQDNGWTNMALVRSGVDGVVDSAAFAEADILLPELVIEKTAIPSVDPLRIGDSVEYEITIENAGDGDFTALYPAVFFDDMSDLLDDATWLSDPADTPGVGSVTPTGSTGYRYAAPLAAGGVVTIVYTVGVTDTGEGDADLVNVAFVSEPDAVAPEAPSVADCEVAVGTCAVTETGLAALEITKTVDQTTVAPGATLNYTITVTNTGQDDLPDGDPAVVTDDLSGVLGNATYNGNATADLGTVEVVVTTLTWEGGLAVGETATITYSVTVNAGAANGVQLVNAAVTDPTLISLAAAGGSAEREVSTTSTVQRIAVTGADNGWLAARIAALLLALGAALAVIQQRRRLQGFTGTA